ncbi:MAG: hypothetical protein JW797_02940 [Bradymonadales bacterium]|nr:hypothetical protein [Bradymonadales bacterium]
MAITARTTVAHRRAPTGRGSRLAALRDFISFSGEIRSLVDNLNREMEAPEKLHFRLPSHPMGFVREVARRRLTIAEAYLKLVSSTRADDCETRLDALRTLVNQALHAKTLQMPVNTARVQVALMKECVKNRGHIRRQLELMSDFSLASYGQPTVIRRVLKDLGLIEVPEEGLPFHKMTLGWDDHVHDFLTEGRKTPSQLVLDAFIKGISHLTVVYFALDDSSLYQEAVKAGEILGVEVHIGWDFSTGEKFRRLHFLYIPPQDGTVATLKAFIQDHPQELEGLRLGLEANAEKRRIAVQALLEDFNQVTLKELNSRYVGHPFLQVPPLTFQELEQLARGGQVATIHLGQLLWKTIMPIQHKRVLYLKNEYRLAAERQRTGEVSSWEVEQRRQRYQAVREEHEQLTVENLFDRHMSSQARVDYDSAFSTPQEILPSLSQCGGHLVFVRPLAYGAEAAVTTLIRNSPWISAVETFNTAVAALRDPADIRRLNLLVGLLNHNKLREITELLADWGITSLTPDELKAACQRYSQEPLQARCGSDSVGQASSVPGMGFISSTSLTPRALKTLQRRNSPTLARPIVQLLQEQREGRSDEKDNGQIFVLGSTSPPSPNPVGDEGEVERVGLLRFWLYLNLNLKSLLKIAIGFVPAYLTLGVGFALVWFLITGMRNFLVDQISAAGFGLRNWRLKNVDRNNLANSLFWTGFSVPILGQAKHGFDLLWPLIGGPSGFLMALAKFWVIAVANGLYIAAHNRLRGFDPKVIRVNFFRTVLSWPLATVGSYGLDLIAIPAIVQAKFWSDVVGGLVEGTDKLRRRLRLAQAYLVEIMLLLLSPDRLTRQVAQADILFIWARRQQGRKALHRVMLQKPEDVFLRAGLNRPDEIQSQQVEHARRELMQSFWAEGSLEDLTATILEHYSGTEAAKLTDLVADHHMRFVLWLKRYRPRDERPVSGSYLPP